MKEVKEAPALTPIITVRGLAAAVQASSLGKPCEITHVGIGATPGLASDSDLTLPGEVFRLPVADGRVINDKQVNISALIDDTQPAVAIHGIAFYLDDGTLFATYRTEDPILNHVAGSTLLVGMDLVMTSIPAGSVVVESTGANLVLGDFVPQSRKVNGKVLRADINLVAGDVGAYTKSETEKLVSDVNKAHEAGEGVHSISSIAGLEKALENAGGKPVLSVEMVQKRDAMWSGYAPADGQLLPRNLYPDAVEAIKAGLVPICDDAEWLSDPKKRGFFTLGDGVNNFRIPDYNGANSGSYGPVYLGGGTSDGGVILRDRIQDFEINAAFAHTLNSSGGNIYKIGSFTRREEDGSGDIESTNRSGARYSVKASDLARAGDTTRPITVEGCLAVKLYGVVQNSGAIDAEYLANAITQLHSNKLDKSLVVGLVGEGAILEEGETATGYYIKFASGTLICRNTGFLRGEVPGYGVAAARWVFPHPFTSSPTKLCGGGVAGENPHLIGYGFEVSAAENSAHQTKVVISSVHSTAMTAAIDVTAIGRWKD